jgi:hypothetical protein
MDILCPIPNPRNDQTTTFRTSKKSIHEWVAVDAGYNNEVNEDVGRLLTRSVRYVDDTYSHQVASSTCCWLDIMILEQRTAC